MERARQASRDSGFLRPPMPLEPPDVCLPISTDFRTELALNWRKANTESGAVVDRGPSLREDGSRFSVTDTSLVRLGDRAETVNVL